MNPLFRGIARVLAAIGLLVLLAAALVVGAVWLTLPGARQTASIPGLTGPVDITYDTDGVPRIHAGSELDAAAAIGFVHARDRMLQMELMRRVASGRVSEIAGAATLPLDRMMRTLGLRQHAVADLAALPPDTRAMLDAYARGVNAWIRLKGRFAAPEFLVLGAPEPWQPSDSLLWAKTMGLWLSMNWRQELARQALAGRVPAALLDQLWPAQPGAEPPDAANTLPERFAAAASRLAAVLPQFPGPYTLPPSASNEWAVDGRHTATGAPLLAGDPHLAFSFPGIWYLVRVDTPNRVLAGATAPGVPFLVLGHNAKIAWTFTTTGADVQDIFIETPAGPNEYQTPTGPQPFTVREERIKVRGRPDQVLTVRETRHGPVISDLDRADGPIMAVAMGNLAPNDTAASGLLALNRATTVGQAQAAAKEISSPVQNLLVADAKTIGLFVTGRVPIRKAGDGAAPVPGDGSHDWIGWAAGDQLPHETAPASGRLVNANEPVWPPGFPIFMGRDTFGDWRARRIRELLKQSDRHTAADFAAMQADVRDDFAAQVLPVLLAVPGTTGTAAKALDLLRGWDASAVMDSPAPLIFNAWIDAFHAAVLRHAGLDHGIGAPVTDFVASVLAPGGEHWCGGDCRPMLRDSLVAAVKRLAARFGDDPAAWRWGVAHQAIFANPILRAIPLLGPFTTISLPSPGDDSTLDRGGTNAALQSVHGAAYRGVYDLADLDRSLFMITPGQSGNPFSAHARDFAIRWRDGATITLGPTASSVSGTVRLNP
ncbi:penicillin acylase family protein [Rhodopila sp.]|uniref:penicillin acylase family protein n=1 Tax=Rhodopila sp. TaxID=2480087 RepID=UPI003D101761